MALPTQNREMWWRHVLSVSNKSDEVYTQNGDRRVATLCFLEISNGKSYFIYLCGNNIIRNRHKWDVQHIVYPVRMLFKGNAYLNNCIQNSFKWSFSSSFFNINIIYFHIMWNMICTSGMRQRSTLRPLHKLSLLQSQYRLLQLNFIHVHIFFIFYMHLIN